MAVKIENKQLSKEFKEEVVKYAIGHPNESAKSISEKFGISKASFYSWKNEDLKIIK